MSNRRRFLTLGWMVAASTMGLACGGESSIPGSFGLEEQSLYRVDSFTDNKTVCSVEGDSVLADDNDHLIVFGVKGWTGDALHAHLCADPAECRKNMQARLSLAGSSISVLDIDFTKVDGDHYTGGMVTTGFNRGNVCADAELTNATLSRVREERIRLETRTVIVNHSPDSAGICWTDDTIKAAKGKPCNRLLVVNATRIEAL